MERLKINTERSRIQANIEESLSSFLYLKENGANRNQGPEIMLGLGRKGGRKVIQTMETKVSMLMLVTIGQYLQPKKTSPG